jgi:hypothetical protein
MSRDPADIATNVDKGTDLHIRIFFAQCVRIFDPVRVMLVDVHEPAVASAQLRTHAMRSGLRDVLWGQCPLTKQN